MAHQSLYRRYRPGRFSEVRGQEPVVRALRNAVANGTEGHAYLFSGPRGTGKTSTARILAKALNCPDLTAGEPCGECESCLAIEHGNSYDLFELDAASNNGVDAMRDLIGRTVVGSPGRTKVYILDEVHMLSAAASNALLKTLEEPPDHVTFVLATTDPQKVLPTIRSRTQHFEFSLLSATELSAYVHWIMDDAGLDVDESSVAHVVRQGRGSARDTLSALDMVVAAGGIADRAEPIEGILAAMRNHDVGAAITAVADAVAQGREPRVLAEHLVVTLRDAFLASVHATLDHLSDADQAAMTDLAKALGPAAITRALELVGSSLVDMRQAADPRVPLEVALIRLCDPGVDTSLGAVVERLERLERLIARGGVPGAAAANAGNSSSSIAEPDVAQSAVTTTTTASPSTPSGSGGAASPASGAAAARAELAARRASSGRPSASTPSPRAATDGAASEVPSAPPAPTSAGRPAPPAPPTSAAARPAAPPPPAAPRSPDRAPSGDEPAPAPAAPPAPSATAGEPAALVGEPAPSAADAPAGAGEPLDADRVAAALADLVAGRLRGIAKAIYAGGRVGRVDGDAVVFALNSAPTRDRAEQSRAEVEALLAEHFGRPVPLRLVDDEAGAGASARSPRAQRPSGGFDALAPSARPEAVATSGAVGGAADGQSSPHDDDDDEDTTIDVHALEDADVATSGLDRLVQAFPGAVVEEESS